MPFMLADPDHQVTELPRGKERHQIGPEKHPRRAQNLWRECMYRAHNHAGTSRLDPKPESASLLRDSPVIYQEEKDSELSVVVECWEQRW